MPLLPKKALSLFGTGEVQDVLRIGTQRLVKGFGEMAADMGVVVRMQGFAGQFQVYFTDGEVVDHRTSARVDTKKYGILQRSILKQRIYSLPPTSFHHGITTAHTDEDMEAILATMGNALREVKAQYLTSPSDMGFGDIVHYWTFHLPVKL